MRTGSTTGGLQGGTIAVPEYPGVSMARAMDINGFMVGLRNKDICFGRVCRVCWACKPGPKIIKLKAYAVTLIGVSRVIGLKPMR